MSVFEDLNINSQLAEAIKKQNIITPTQVQEESIPLIMEGQDVIGESATGSGKTLAFGCGIIRTAVPGKGIQALVLTPTRELADQVKLSLKKLSYGKTLNIIAIYGGVAIGPQIQELSRADVVVATPGRMLDHLSRQTVDLSKVSVLVLDEADRMLEMGFIEDVEQIIKLCPKDRQTLFFSATISPDIKRLSKRYMKNPVQVNAVRQVDPKKLKQVYYDVPKNLKLSVLVHLLKKEREGLVMVFCNTRRNTDFVVKNLKANKIDAVAIHGGLTQNKRSKTMTKFNKAKVEVLVCTDVAARGLHVDNVSHVYNYDLPADPKDYVHRIGRTARAGEEGKVVNVLCDYDYDNFSRIMTDYREFTIKKMEKPHVEKLASVQADSSGGRFGSRPGRSGGRFGNRSGFRGGRTGGRSGGNPRSRFGSRSGGRSGGRRGSGSFGRR